jgi:hypothetical protein
MKAIHLTARLALILLPVATATAATRSTAEPVAALADGGTEGDVPGDFNEDGNPDLLFQNRNTGNLRVEFMRKTQPVAAAALSPAGTGDPSVLAVGADDFDRDGNTDILFWHMPSRDENSPSPGQGELLIWHLDGRNNLIYESKVGQMIQYMPVSIFDFDGDGLPDILFQSQAPPLRLLVWIMNGTQVVDRVRLDLATPEASAGWRVAGTGDFDRDGDVDLVLHRVGTFGPQSSGIGVVAIAVMKGTTGQVEVVGRHGDRNWELTGVADFTRDGFPDLIWEHLATGELGAWEMRLLEVTARYAIAPVSPSLERGWHIVAPR